MIDVFVTSASRPELLRKTLESFAKLVVYSGRLNYFVHEDYVDSNRSAICIGVCGDILGSHKLVCSHPPRGLSGAFKLFASSFLKSDYMFYLQDDWELVREINFDSIFSMINSWSDVMTINQLRFNKRKTMAYKGEGDDIWNKKEVSLGEYRLTTSDAVYLNPALWNMKFFRPYLMRDFTGKPTQRPFIWKLNGYIAGFFGMKKGDKTGFSRAVGTYIYGGIGEKAYFKHLGSNDRAQVRSKVW